MFVAWWWCTILFPVPCCTSVWWRNQTECLGLQTGMNIRKHFRTVWFSLYKILRWSAIWSEKQVKRKCVYLSVYYMVNLLQDKGLWHLCLVLNKNWFCLMPVHTCVANCAWNVGYICYWGASFLWGCSSGGVYIPCIYTHARWELP